MKRLALLTLAVFGTIAGFLLLYAFRSVVILFVGALIVAATVRPLAVRLTKVGLPRSLAMILMVLLVFAGIFAVLGVSAYVVAEDMPRAVTDFQIEYGRMRSELAEGESWQQALAARLPQPETLEDLLARIQSDAGVAAGEAGDAATPSGEEAATPAGTAAAAPNGEAETSAVTDSQRRATGLLRALVGTTGSVAGLLTQFILVVFVSLYWSLEYEWFERLWISLLRPDRRARARATWRAVESNVGAHIRSELVQSVAAFVLLWAGFWAMGISYPLLLAWASAIAWLIPLVGWLVALLPVVLLGLLAGPWVAVGAALYMTVIFAFLEFVVEPRLDVRRRAGSILGLLVALVLLEWFGILGLLIASPVGVAINTFVKNAFALQPTVPAQAQLSVDQLEQRMTELRAAMGRAGEEIPPRTRSLYERLQELVLRVERTV